MKKSKKAKLIAICLSISAITQVAFSQGTGFTYQGQLQNNGNLVDGYYDMRFHIYSAVTSGTLIAGPVTNTAVAVSNGLFTTLIDFGAGVFTGSSNWLQIGIRTNGAANFTVLSPRQQLTPTPYAIFAETANAAGLSGTVPTGDLNLSGVNGSGLIDLNASQLTTGTVPLAVLPSNVALLNANQIFTGNNVFTAPGQSFIIDGSGPISTSLFTGLGLQYYATGEGAIMSSFNDGYGYLTFYTKQGGGYPLVQQMQIDKWGGVHIDQQNYNEGIINDGTTNGVGLTFGKSSGEGIASQRTAGTSANQYGLDFYTDFARRMSISQGGLVGINVGTNLPTNQLEVNGTVRLDGSWLYLDSTAGGAYASDGLVFGDGGLAGINYGGNGPFLAGYEGGALGGLSPNYVCLSWDPFGNVAVSNKLTTGSFEMKGEFLVVDGLTPVLAYIGDDGNGNDVQIGSEKSGVTALAAYNTADNAYMHFYCSAVTIEGGSDLAEPFNFSESKEEITQGAVVVIDNQNPGHLKLSDQAYDTRVAGVVSGANGINPGIQMQQQGALEGGKNVALTGRVYVLADNSNGVIRPGDLLTTSGIPGHAMKVTDHARAQGAILGKAMSGLDEAKGMVLVLVTLQ